jgi:hypothetical protein
VAIVEGVVFEDRDVPYTERILQIVDVAKLYAARCEEALLELGIQYITGRGASSSLYWGIGEMRNRAKPWRSPGTGAQGDFMTVAVMDVERG